MVGGVSVRIMTVNARYIAEPLEVLGENDLLARDPVDLGLSGLELPLQLVLCGVEVAVDPPLPSLEVPSLFLGLLLGPKGQNEGTDRNE